MQTYIETLESMNSSALENELISLGRLSDKYRDEVRKKTNLVLQRMNNG